MHVCPRPRQQSVTRSEPERSAGWISGCLSVVAALAVAVSAVLTEAEALVAAVVAARVVAVAVLAVARVDKPASFGYRAAIGCR